MILVLVAVTRDDVQAVVRTLLLPDDFSTLIISPGEPGAVPAVLADSTGVAEPIAVADRPEVEVPKLEAGKPGKASLPAREAGALSNGIGLVHYQVPGSPMTYVSRDSDGRVWLRRSGQGGADRAHVGDVADGSGGSRLRGVQPGEQGYRCGGFGFGGYGAHGGGAGGAAGQAEGGR